MKRFLTILLTTLALTAALCVSASASNFDGPARELSKIGMLKGTADGFNLDQVPTRGQAAIMLVRLFGTETQAQNTYRSGRITCPFTDVNETVAPYVAWLADEGLASGITATTFGASQPCTAKAYTIFLLRALGYQDRVDFTTANAEDFALSLGLLDTSAFTGTFLRDDLVALTYQALGTDMKDGKTYLLDYLIKEAEISANDARPIVEKIEACRAINRASEALNKGLSASFEMNMEATVSNTVAGAAQPDGRIENTNVSLKGDIMTTLSKDIRMAMDLTMSVDGESENVKMWMRDGWVYTQSGETAVKTEMDDDTYKALLSLLESSANGKSSGGAVLPFLESVGIKNSGRQTAYTLELGSAFENTINSLITQILKETGLPEGIVGKLNMKGLTMVYNVNNGKLESVAADTALSMNLPGSDGGTTTVGISMDMNLSVKASGDNVKITFPSFSDFEEVIGGADGPTGIFGSFTA